MLIADSLVQLASAAFTFFNTKEAKKYLNETVEIQEAILKERNKGDERDDAKLETLYKRLAIIAEAAKSELLLRAK
jgi:hypothetical protein